MSDIACIWDPARRTVLVHVPHAITGHQLKAVVETARKIDHARWIGAQPGDARDILKAKIDAIDAGRYQQVVSGRGDRNFFKATPSTGKIIVGAGL